MYKFHMDGFQASPDSRNYISRYLFGSLHSRGWLGELYQGTASIFELVSLSRIGEEAWKSGLVSIKDGPTAWEIRFFPGCKAINSVFHKMFTS